MTGTERQGGGGNRRASWQGLGLWSGAIALLVAGPALAQAAGRGPVRAVSLESIAPIDLSAEGSNAMSDAIAEPGLPVSVVAQVPGGVQTSTQVTVNGRAIPNSWSSWASWTDNGQTRIGLSDGAIAQLVGAELLDTNDPTRQPIQWFAPNPVTLVARQAGAFRYLDITDWARDRGWQLRPNGSTLEITAAVPNLRLIRQGDQAWGKRYVLEFDRAGAVQLEEDGSTLLVALDARSALPPNSTTLDVTAAGNRTVVKIPIPEGTRPRAFTLVQPDRLVIDMRADWLPTRSIAWANGLRWRQQYVSLGAARFPVQLLELDPRQPGLRLRSLPPNANGQTGIAPLVQTIRQWEAPAGINGGYFNRNTQLPLGALRRDGRWLSGPILGRGAVGWNDAGQFLFDRLQLREQVTAGSQSWTLTTLNSGYIQAGIARYTSGWGTTYKTLSDGEVGIVVQGDRVVQQLPGGAAGSSSFPIPAEGYLLVARSLASAAPALPVGTTVRLQSSSNPSGFDSLPNIIAAGPLLVKDSQIVLDPKREGFSDSFIVEQAARSGFGQMADGRLLVVSVHNRVGGRGPSLGEMAQLMRQLGTVNAVNFDGGSSTTLVVGGRVVDRPSRSSARVHGALGIFLNSP
ncbi:MAG TPA: phosphodiester glycosidase family protein [Coleofasciculaceae cyanobacterium]